MYRLYAIQLEEILEKTSAGIIVVKFSPIEN